MTDNPGGQQFDLIVIGLGPGGEEVAERMAEAGWSVLGIESRLVGGECPYYGCIPSKMVVRGAEVLAEARRIPELAGAAEVKPDYRMVATRIRDEATDNWDDTVAVERLERLGGTLARGSGVLAGRADDGTIRVRVGEAEHRARHVVIAVGTAPAIPPINGLADLERGVDGPVWTNREVLQARQAPASLAVLGGGPIGVEIGQGLARFGTRVTVIELSRNFGHHKAMITGLEASGGDFVFLIYSDLEEEPEWLPVFWRKLHDVPADVVYGYQTSRKGSALERLGAVVLGLGSRRFETAGAVKLFPS